MSTEREKMLRGELYDASGGELVNLRFRARELWQQLNLLPSASDRASLRRSRRRTAARSSPPRRRCRGGRGARCSAPRVQLYTASHPLDAAQRVAGPELALPIRIGSRVWVGGRVVVCPGVTIGDDTTIGAGSVVTRPIPAGVVAAGNPCRVLRRV